MGLLQESLSARLALEHPQTTQHHAQQHLALTDQCHVHLPLLFRLQQVFLRSGSSRSVLGPAPAGLFWIRPDRSFLGQAAAGQERTSQVDLDPRLVPLVAGAAAAAPGGLARARLALRQRPVRERAVVGHLRMADKQGNLSALMEERECILANAVLCTFEDIMDCSVMSMLGHQP